MTATTSDRAAAGRDADRAAAPGGRGSAAAPAADAAHPCRRPGGDRDRQSATLGTRSRCSAPCSPKRSPAGTGPRWRPAERGRVPHREDLPRLETRSILHPRPHPAGAADPGMGAPQGEPRRLRAVRDREDVPPRSPRPSRRRTRPARRLVHPRRPRRPDPPPPRRRHRHQSHRPDPARRSRRRRRHRAAAGRADAAEGLYRLVDAAYEKRSVAISSNLHPAGFDELMPKTLATATVDRLLHHAHVCQTSGESVRLSQALTGQGVNPLT